MANIDVPAVSPDGYTVDSIIGRGSFSAVWLATQLSTGREVALKILEVDVGDPVARRRFDRERDAMNSLSGHPHIVTMYDAGIVGSRPWIALELCRAGSYAVRLTDSGPIGPEEAVGLLIDIGRALANAHASGVLHCDVKPANIMIGEFGPALADFGVARTTASGHTRTSTGGYSLDHVAPELLDDREPTDRSDVYSLGTTVWELLTGHPPFRTSAETSAAAVVRRILLDELPPLGRDDLHAGLADLIALMAAKDAGDRPSMHDVVARALAMRASAGTADAESTAMSSLSTAAGPIVDDLGATRLHTPRRAAGLISPTSRPAPSEALVGATRRRRRSRVAAVAVALAAVVTAGAIVTPGLLSAKTDALAARPDLVLEGSTSMMTIPFTPDFRTQPAPTGLAAVSSLPQGITGASVIGSAEGIYRGTKGAAACDREGVATFFKDHSDAAAGWISTFSGLPGTAVPAGFARVTPQTLPAYIASLTPGLLRMDTKITEYSDEPGHAAQQQAILQAGTAVLVDTVGLPRLRCASGSPLSPPDPSAPSATRGGAEWPGISPESAVTITPSKIAIRQFGLADTDGNVIFRRPAGTSGAYDFDQSPDNAQIEGIYKLDMMLAACVNLTGCTVGARGSSTLRVSGCAKDMCQIASLTGGWTGQFELSRVAAGWHAAGPAAVPHPCQGHGTKPTQIDLTIAPKNIAVDASGVWIANGISGTESKISTSNGACKSPSTQAWNIDGNRNAS